MSGDTCTANPVFVPVGGIAALPCPSNDDNHVFNFWEFGNNNIIGPGNLYDANKYKYEVLSGKLFIKNVLPTESGCYNCYSQHINGASHSVHSVHMITNGSLSTHESIIQPVVETAMSLSRGDLSPQRVDVAVDTVKLVAIIVSVIVIIGCAVIYIWLRREWNKYDGRMVVPMEDDDDEDGDEIYNRTTTTIEGPSRTASSDQLYGRDNRGLDTDFNSVFQQIQIKSPQHSLI